MTYKGITFVASTSDCWNAHHLPVRCFDKPADAIHTRPTDGNRVLTEAIGLLGDGSNAPGFYTWPDFRRIASCCKKIFILEIFLCANLRYAAGQTTHDWHRLKVAVERLCESGQQDPSVIFRLHSAHAFEGSKCFCLGDRHTQLTIPSPLWSQDQSTLIAERYERGNVTPLSTYLPPATEGNVVCEPCTYG